MTTLSHNSVKIIHFPGGPVNPVNGRGRVKQRKQESPALHVVSSANRPFLHTNQRSRAIARKSRTAALNRLGRQLQALGNEGYSESFQTGENHQRVLALFESAAL